MSIFRKLFGKSDDNLSKVMLELADATAIDVVKVDGVIECFWLITGLNKDELRAKFKNTDAVQVYVNAIEARLKKKDYIDDDAVNFEAISGKSKQLGFVTRAVVDNENNVIFNWKKDITYTAEDYINGNYGKAVVELMSPLAKHFLGLSNWENVELDLQELVWLATFIAHINLKDEQVKNKLTDTQIDAVCTGIAMRYAQIEYGKQFSNEILQLLLSKYNTRYKEYKTLWADVVVAKRLDAFALHAFEKVQDGEVTSNGYAEHYATFAILIDELGRVLNAADVRG